MAANGGDGLSRLGPEFVALNISGGESVSKEDDGFKTRNVWRVSFILYFQQSCIRRSGQDIHILRKSSGMCCALT